jgi:hypothetical protein
MRIIEFGSKVIRSGVNREAMKQTDTNSRGGLLWRPQSPLVCAWRLFPRRGEGGGGVTTYPTSHVAPGVGLNRNSS